MACYIMKLKRLLILHKRKTIVILKIVFCIQALLDELGFIETFSALAIQRLIRILTAILHRAVDSAVYVCP
jgi:hypothetical protein